MSDIHSDTMETAFRFLMGKVQQAAQPHRLQGMFCVEEEIVRFLVTLKLLYELIFFKHALVFKDDSNKVAVWSFPAKFFPGPNQLLASGNCAYTWFHGTSQAGTLGILKAGKSAPADPLLQQCSFTKRINVASLEQEAPRRVPVVHSCSKDMIRESSAQFECIHLILAAAVDEETGAIGEENPQSCLKSGTAGFF